MICSLIHLFAALIAKDAMYKHTHTHVRKYAHTHARVHTHTHTHSHTHTHTHTHTQIHTNTRIDVCLYVLSRVRGTANSR